MSSSKINFDSLGEISSLVNVFAAPWKDSDIVLVVEDTEFHVHRSILTLQSPVFKAMLNGHFIEASQEKIALEGKTSQDMLHFLKLLYPQNMIKKPLTSLEGENVFKILVLADEYQAEDVMNQCLEETNITAENAFKIKPYALKYNESVCKQCDEVMKRNIATCEIEKELPALEREQAEKLLVAKCCFLESVALRSYNLLRYLMWQYLDNMPDGTTSVLLNSDYCCGHEVCINEFNKARKCQHCLRAFKSNIIDKVLPNKGLVDVEFAKLVKYRNILFDTLQDCDDVVASIKVSRANQPTVP